jgi:hypothetical protein
MEIVKNNCARKRDADPNDDKNTGANTDKDCGFYSYYIRGPFSYDTTSFMMTFFTSITSYLFLTRICNAIANV